jgi:hypothetical protein
MRGNPYKKYRREPQLKIGSKAENILYSEKNINPDLNFFNKQLSEEEYLSNKRKIYQKEEFSTLSKNFQDNYMGPPNLAHQRIDVDNVSGKIGQERREMEISKYQSQPSFAKDQVYNTYINNDRERNNKKYYHNIINNTIFGFCDPGMKYPKTSYQSNFRGNDINEQLKYLSKRQYEDYLQFRKEQIELMNKGNLGKNLRELPPRKRKEEMNFEEIRNNMGERELRDKRIKDEADNLMKEQRILDQNQVRTLNPNGYIPSPEEYDNYLKQKREQERNELNNNNNKNINIPQPESYPKEINNNININRRTPYNNQNENMEMNMNREMVNNIENNPNLDKKYYYPEPSQNYPPNINQEKQEEFYQREQMRKTPIKEELPPQNINNNQYNNEEIYNNPQMPKYTPKNIKEEYNYGNEVPHSYEEYQRLMQKEAERENNLLKQRQLEQENVNNMNSLNNLNNIQLTKSEEEEFKQYQKEKQNIPMNNYHEQENNVELNEEQLKLKQREEAEAEYLKNVKKYEDIIQDNPEQRFKLPPPPFGSSNIPMMNKMSMESQIQGAEPGYINKMNQVSENPYSIDKYSLGESKLSQNPILHPVNSYQFDFRRLYNPLTNKNN